ncbi:TetR/AcrR family transcriptional regulator [Methylophaga sulfidovorans]|uniref:Transcriptional regulator, TetR family n=1 Tax=Methylophaga sulfidovorans TaxID=45496 RepID=A0A1I4A7K3_9GAMM|nr:TetR/AcrR family transcriptional regulator [Methylophaga sulfidovorans]SFK51799.1 transcriptional regulator, TetR family [Methylophaga sulfidovorans]
MSTQKDIKKEQILNHGIQLLMRNGYHGTGIKLILDTVQVPKGSFYSYFESKENFTSEAISHYIAPFISRLQFFLNKTELNGHQAVKAYFESLIKDLEQSDYSGGCLLGDMMGEISSASELCRQTLLASVNDYCQLIAQGLNEAQQQGIVRQDMTADVMAKLLFDHWQGALLHMKIEKSTQPLKRCMSQLLDDYFVQH